MDKTRNDTSAALVRYDTAACEKAELLGITSFCYGYHEIFHTFLGLEHLKPKKDESESKNDNVMNL